MFTSNTASPLTLTAIEFKPALGSTGEKFLGRFPPTASMAFPDRVCRQIERQVAPHIEDLVG